MQNGIYYVKNLAFDSKVDALIYASTCDKTTTVEWSFYDEVFSQIDWKVPVTETVSDLCKKRAIQLREKYDHLALSYSGGADSTNILQTFIKNNIRLDEIVMFNPEDDKNQPHFWNETKLAAIPYLKKYLKDSKTKVRIINIMDSTKTFLENKLDIDLNTSNWLSPSYMYISSTIAHDKFWNSLYTKNKKIAFIVGIDKPPLSIENNNFYCSFSDSVAQMNQRPKLNQNKLTSADDNFSFEYFYWTPDVPLLIVKQCQLIKEACLRSEEIKKIIAQRDLHSPVYLNLINDIIYSEDVTYVKNLFYEKKPSGVYVSVTSHSHNDYFFKNFDTTEIGRYKDVVLNTHKLIDSRFFQPTYMVKRIQIYKKMNLLQQSVFSQTVDFVHKNIITDIDKLPTRYKIIKSRKYIL